MAAFLAVLSIVLLCRGPSVVHSSASSPAPCDDLSQPLHGTVKVIQHNPGHTKAIYCCNKGFALKGRRKRLCCDSEWLGEEPECRQVCSIADFTNTVRVEVQSDGASTSTEAESVVLTCPDGYFPAGGDQRRCEGEWSQPAYPTPCLKECSEPENPENGKVVFNNRSGAVYFCDFGFQLIGSPERRCIDGDWTGAQPFCINQSQSEILGHQFGISGPDVFTKDATTLKTADFLMPAARDDEPARRSVFFLYRIKPPSNGTVRVTVHFTLLPNETEVLVNRSESTFQNGSDAFILRPACIELFSNVTTTFRAAVQLDVRFLDAEETAFEIRDLETSQTQQCIDRPGKCPPSLETSRCGTFCRHDGNCAEEQKCCSTSCGVDCLTLITTQSNTTQSNTTQSNTTQNTRRRRSPNENSPTDCCDNNPDSGDCGFKGSGCSGSSMRWQVVANDKNENASDDSVEKVDLTPVDLKRDCDFDVCIQCLQQKSAHSKRRRRSHLDDLDAFPPFIQLAKSKSFCLFDNEDQVVYDKMRTDLISGKKSIAKFKLRMLKGGFHIMVIRLFCSDSAIPIKLGGEKEKFQDLVLTHFDFFNDYPKKGEECEEECIIKVREMIERSKNYSGKCSFYRLEFEIALVFTPACVESIVFT